MPQTSHLHSRSPVVLVCAVALTACAGALSGRHGLERAAGCWVSNVRWPDTLGLFLDAEGLPGTVLPPPPVPGLIHNNWLLIDDSDSIRVNLGYGGFAGATIRARLEGDSLVGTSLPFTDEVGGLEPAPVRFVARRIVCPPGWQNP
jgi:hypothetical protein